MKKLVILLLLITATAWACEPDTLDAPTVFKADVTSLKFHGDGDEVADSLYGVTEVQYWRIDSTNTVTRFTPAIFWEKFYNVVPCTLYVFAVDTTGWREKDSTWYNPNCPANRPGCCVMHWTTKKIWLPVLDTVIVSQHEIDCGFDESYFPIKLKNNRWMELK